MCAWARGPQGVIGSGLFSLFGVDKVGSDELTIHQISCPTTTLPSQTSTP